MNKRTKKILTWVLLPVFVCLAVAAVELGFNWKRMSLPAEQQGEIALDLASFVVTQAEPAPDAEAGEEGFEDEAFADEEEAEGPVVALADENTQATLAWSGYIHQLKLSGQVFNDTGYTVLCTLADGSTASYSSTYNTVLASDSITIDAEVTSLTLSAPAGGMTLQSITVDNATGVNQARALFTALCALCAYLLVALHTLIGKKAEYGFLIVALAMGLFLSVALPRNTAESFDDQIHFNKVWNLSMGRDVKVTNSADALINLTWTTKQGDTFVLTQDTEDEQRQLDALLDAGGDLENATASIQRQWILTDAGYATQAAGLALARAAGLPFHWQVIVARMFNMLTYVLLSFFAIKALKRYKMVFATVALLPTPMFMASCFSYDPTCLGLCMLGTALLVDAILDRDTLLSWQRALVIPVCFVLAGCIKAVYMPLLLLVLLLPRSKFASNTARLWYKIGMMILMVAVVGSILLAIGEDVSNIEDSRGEGADAMGQLAFILGNPFTYVGYFFSALYRHFDVYLLDSYRNTWAYMGGLSGWQGQLSLIAIGLACFFDYDAATKQRFNWKQRLVTLIVALATIGLTFTAMYIGYSAVGEPDFGGVQGRYLIPALPLLYMLLSFDFIKNPIPRRYWNLLLYGLNAVVLLGCCATCILPRCL